MLQTHIHYYYYYCFIIYIYPFRLHSAWFLSHVPTLCDTLYYVINIWNVAAVSILFYCFAYTRLYTVFRKVTSDRSCRYDILTNFVFLLPCIWKMCGKFGVHCLCVSRLYNELSQSKLFRKVSVFDSENMFIRVFFFHHKC